MKKVDAKQAVSANFAAQMAAGWTDEHLLSKTGLDLVKAYGCNLANAERILNNELTKRKLRR